MEFLWILLLFVGALPLMVVVLPEPYWPLVAQISVAPLILTCVVSPSNVSKQ